MVFSLLHVSILFKVKSDYIGYVDLIFKKRIFRDRCFQTHIKITTQQSIFLTNTLVASTNLYFGSNNGIATASLQLMIYPTF